MISNNLSHETFVIDEKYNNLPDYEYNDIYVNNENKTTSCYRFAKNKNGDYGIVP